VILNSSIQIEMLCLNVGPLFVLLLVVSQNTPGWVSATSTESKHESTDVGSTNFLSSPTSKLVWPRHLQPGSKKSIGLVGLTSASTSLSDKAFEISGNTTFACRLKEQEEEERRKQNEPNEAKEKPQHQEPANASRVFYGGMLILFALSSSVLNETSAAFVASMARNIATSITNPLKMSFGSVCKLLCRKLTMSAHEIISASASALAIAWLPTLLMGAGWQELASLVLLFLRPSVRNFMQLEALPVMWSTLQTVLLKEVWRNIYKVLLSPLPKNFLLPPSTYQDVSLHPWLGRGLEKWNEMIDKYSQTLIRQSIQKNVRGSIEVFYEYATSSMAEVSILYEDFVSLKTEEESPSLMVVESPSSDESTESLMEEETIDSCGND